MQSIRLGRARTVRARAADGQGGQQTSLNKPVNNLRQHNSGGSPEDERIREFLPKVAEEQERAAKSGGDLNRIVQWAGELGSKAQQAFAELQKSVSSLGDDIPQAAEEAEAAARTAAAEAGGVDALMDRLGVRGAAAGAAPSSEGAGGKPSPEPAGQHPEASAELLQRREAGILELEDDIEAAAARLDEDPQIVPSEVAEVAEQLPLVKAMMPLIKAEEIVNEVVGKAGDVIPMRREDAGQIAEAVAEAVAVKAEELVEESEVVTEALEGEARELAEAEAAGGEGAGAAAARLGEGKPEAQDVVSKVKVEIAVRRKTSPGQDVWVVGSAPALGAWDPDKALPLKWTDGHVWRTTIELDPTQVPSVEYKALVKSADGPALWEKGDNRTADVTSPEDGGPLTLFHNFTA